MANPNDNIHRLYQNGLKHFSLPDFDTFQQDMKDEEKRKRFYTNMQEAYSLPDFDTFSQDIGAVVPPQPQQQQTTITVKPITDNTAASAAVQSTVNTSSQSEQPTRWKPSAVQQRAFQTTMERANTRFQQLGEEAQQRLAGIQKGNQPRAFMGERELNQQTGKMETGYYTQQGERVGSRIEQSRRNAEYHTWWENNTEAGRRSKEQRLQREFDARLAHLWQRHNPTEGENAAEQTWSAAEASQSAARNRNADRHWDSYNAIGGGRELRVVTTSMNRHDDLADHFTNFDLDRLMNDSWNNLGEDGQQALIDDCHKMLRYRYPGTDDLVLYKQAQELARQQSDLRLYNLAVEKNRPKSELEYLMRKIGDMNVILSLTKAAAVSKAGTTGDMATYEAANEEYRQDGHKILDVAGTVTGFALDPTTWISGGVGSLAGKGAVSLGGRWMAGRGASAAVKQAATRQFATSMTGRVIGGVAGGSANFGTFEGLKEVENQMVHGGHIVGQDDRGRYINEGYSASAVAGQAGHGLLMGAAIGWITPVSGNVSDKLVRGISSTVGKVAERTGLYAGATTLEGTIFSVPEWIEGNRDAMDVWTDNMAMMVGFKTKHILKSAGGVLGDLKASFDSPTNGRKNRLDFESRLRMRMDAPSDGGLALTKDERAELERNGYGDLRELVESAERTGNVAEGSLITENATEIVSRLTDMVTDTHISEAARAKMYYYATGRKLPESTIMRGEMVEDGNGGFIVESQGANGVITSRTFSNRKAADLELERIRRQAELNHIEIGERYQQTADFEKRLQDACRTVAAENGWDMVEVYRICEEARRNYLKGVDKQLDEAHQNILGKVVDAMGEFEETGVTDTMRGRINEKYGVDIDAAIRKESNRRTQAEQIAIDEYLNELIPNKAKEHPIEDANAVDITNQKFLTDESETHADELGNGEPFDSRFSGGEPVVGSDSHQPSGEQKPIGRAVMKFGDRPVEVLSGRIVLTDNGTMLENAASDKSIVIRDLATGKIEMVAPEAILSYEEYPAKPIVDKPVDNSAVETSAEEAPATEQPKYGAGQITIRNTDGTATHGWLTGEVDEEGKFEYYVEGDLQHLHYATEHELDNIVTDFKPDAPKEPEAPAENIPTDGNNGGKNIPANSKEYEQGYTMGMQDVHNYTDEQLDALIIKMTTDAERLTDFGKGLLSAYQYELQRREAEKPRQAQQEETSAETAPQPIEMQPTAESVPKTPESVPNPAENAVAGAEIVPEAVPTVENVQEQTPLQRIPRNEKGEPIFEQAETPEHGWDALVEFAEGDKSTAKEIADTMAEEKRKAYEKAQKLKPKGKTPTEILSSKKVNAAELAKAQAEYEQWQKMAGIEQSRQAAIRSQQEAEDRRLAEERAERDKADRAAREEAERIEREALEGIPEWHMDTPENARARGTRRFNGQMFTRQEPVQGVVGNEVEVKFSQSDLPKGRVVVIEASQLQPSHTQGRRNPMFFIDEAQPKNRAESVSTFAAQQIAEGIRPEEITGSATAYTGAPTVNTRGEVIQGNSRSDALRYLWENNLPQQQQAYKQYLVDNAGPLGLDAGVVNAMQQPVLVNMLDVDDAEAIRLGQMTAQDTESGGIERIKPKNVAQKLGEDMRQFANMLLRGGDEEASFGQLVDRNGTDVLKWMNQVGAISNTQYQSAFDSKGNITSEAKNDLQKVLYQAVFKGGSRQLEEMFDKLPAKAQRAILATAFRDMDSPFAGKMLPEIQASIVAFNQLMQDTTFAEAKKMEEVLRAVDNFKRSFLLDDRFEQYKPADNFSNFALHLAAMYKANDMSQNTIASYFNQMYDLAQGKKAATLFEEADTTEYPLVEVIKQVLGFEYKPAKNGNNNVANGGADVALRNQIGQGGELRGNEPPASGEQTPGRTEPSKRGAGTVLPVVERGGQRDLSDSQRRQQDNIQPTETEGVSYKLSEEVDEDGSPFVLSSKGNTNFGVISEESGLTSAPIKLSLGNSKYGLKHLEKRHGDEIREAGFDTVEGFVEYVANNFSHIREGENSMGEANGTYLLQLEDAHNNTLYVELSTDGSYWGVNSGGVFRKGYGKNKKEVWSASEEQNKQSATDNTLRTEDNTDNPTAPNGTVSNASDDKITALSSDKQISEEESSSQLTDGKGTSSVQAAVEAASAEVNTEPTEAQKEAGNYKKGHVKIDGLEITIEQPKGSIRRGTDENGKEWEQEMHNTYGYIRNTEGVDGDHIDVFLSDNPEQGDVFVVDQVAMGGIFDEHKVMYGFNSEEEARTAYLSNYEDGWQGLGAITRVSKEEFNKWIQSSHRKTKPFADYSTVSKETDNEPTTIKGEGYSIAPKPYTNKQGKTLDTYLVKFERDFSKEEMSALRAKAKEVKGWYDREAKGWMLRSEAEAKAFAEGFVGKSEDDIADQAPLSMADMEMQSPVKKVNLEGVVGDLRKKGSAKLSDHAEPAEAPKPKKRSKWISDEDAAEFDNLRNNLRSHLGADQDMVHEDAPSYGKPQPKQMDAEVLRMGTRMTYLMMKGGLRKFSDYAEAMVEEVGDAIRPHLKSLYAAAQNMEEVMQLDWDEEMDDRKTVKSFDVYNFDKSGAKDIIGTAQHITEEMQSERDTEKVIQDLKEQRNERREKEADETSADTETIVDKAETTASKVESGLEAAKTEEDTDRLNQSLDKELEEVNKQLALLGYYKAAPVDKDFNEAYGFMRNTERKATQDDAHRLPNDEVLPATPLTPQPREDLVQMAERVAKDRQAPKAPAVEPQTTICDLFGGLFDNIENDTTSAPAITVPEQRPVADLMGDSAAYQEREAQTVALVEEIEGVIENRVGMLQLNPDIVKPLTMTEVKRMAAKYSALKEISDTDLQELVELAMTQLTRSEALVNVEGTAEQQRTAFDHIVNLYQMQPSLNARDSERLIKQQYSTPTPFGFVMGQFVRAGGKTVSSMLEPSAGNGALTITVHPSLVHVNDIDDARLANLRKLGYGQVTAQDALLPFSGDKVDVVMTNPPFGTVTEKVYDGVFRVSSLEGQMAINALEQMKDDGRAAIVIGGNTSYRTNGSINPKDAAFFGYLCSHYNVSDIINISGKALYSRNGTGYDVRMILIDGRKTGEFQRVFPPVKSKARAEQVTTFDELYKRVQDDIQQIQQVGNQSANVQRDTETTADGTASAPVRSGNNHSNTGAGQRPGKTGDAVRDTPRTDSGQSAPRNDGSSPVGVDNADGGNAGSSDNVQQPKPQQSRSIGGGSTHDGAGRSGSDGRGAVASRPDRGAERLDVKPDLTTEKVPYPSQSGNGFTLMSVVPAAQATVLQKSLGEIGDVDQYLVDELGYSSKDELYKYLAAEQIDSVALAIHQMNKGNAFIIGDMTGVGKGRQGAALIRYAVKQGKVPIYFTQKPTLYTDNYRDLADIGSSDLRPFIIASNAKDANIVDADGNVVHKLPSKKEQERVFSYIMEHGTLPDEYDYVLTTYDQIKNGTADYAQNEDGTWKIEERKLPKKSKGYTTADYNGQTRRDALARLAEGNIAILDESHTVGGDSGCGRYMQMLTSQAGGVTFLSATFAKRADNMPIYAQRTAIAEAGIKASELIEAIMKGGVTLQEIMSKQLVESGQMIRRERSFDGVTIDWLSVEEETNRRQREQFNEVANIFNAIRNFQDDYITPIIDSKNEAAAEVGATVGHTQGTKDLGVKNVPFASKMYNLVNQLLFTLKVDAVADRVVENLRNGYKPVISFTNTMEGFLSSAPKGVTMDDVPNFSLTLMRALDGVMRYTEKDADENSEGGAISLSELSTEGQNAYNAIREKIMNLSADLPISPMDAIRMKIEEAGYSVAEITGRTMQLNRTEDGRYIVEARKDRDKKAAMRDFNSGKLDVLMINKSGSTGISLHASSKFEDRRPRVMVFAQFQSDINDEVQMRGRIDRSGQVTRGRYEYIMSTIPAEQRIQMMFKAKLKSLDANTTSSQKSKFNEMEIVDYLNKYGDEVVWEYMKEHPELAERLGDPLDMLQEKKDEDGPRTSEKEDTSKKSGCAGKISRYLAFLSVEEQDEIFREITEAYRVKIQLLDDAGENDLEITTMPLRANTKRKQIWHEGENPGSSNAFAGNTYVEEVEVDVLKKPMKRDEIAEATRKFMGEHYTEQNGGVDWQHYVRAKGDEIELFFQAKANESVDKLREAGEVRITKAREKAVSAATKARGRGENNFTDEEIHSLADTVANEERIKEEQKQRKRQEEIMEVKNRILSLLQRLRAESIYVVPQELQQGSAEMFSQTFGTFVGFKFNKSYTLGSSTAIFATLDGRRKVELALSDPAINTIITATEIAYRYSPKEINAITMENWDSKVPTQTRQKRYIITGNLLQALVDTEKGDKTKGNLISYSTIDGETRQGILMGESFKLTDLRNSASLSSRLAQIREGQAVISENGDVQIEKISFGWQHRGDYELRVPKSKQRGGIYTMHPDLLKLVEDSNFISKGNNMVAYVKDNNIAKVVDMLSRAPFNVTVLQASNLTDVNTSAEAEEDLSNAKKKLSEYDELMKQEMEAKEAKYADVDKDVEAAENVELTEEDSEDAASEPDAYYNERRPQTFTERQRRAVEERGTVAPGLANMVVKVVEVPRHDFSSDKPISQARIWAKENLVGEHELRDDDGNVVRYVISKRAIDKYLSSSAIDKSENLGAHLSVLKKLPEVIGASIEAEVHPDYIKGEDGVRRIENGYNEDNLIHRLYGAIGIDGDTFIVKTTIIEPSDNGAVLKPHSYEVTEIELLPEDNSSKVEPTASTKIWAPVGTAKLLKGVEKSYDKGVKLLNASKNNSNFASRYETEDGKTVNYTSENPEAYGGLFDFDFTAENEASRGIGVRTGANEVRLENNPDRTEPGSGLNKAKGEFAVVERIFKETGSFNFMSGERIESADDVAFIFSALEDAAKEHAFVVLVKNGKPTVVELGMGTFTASLVDTPTASLAYSRIKPDQVYFVHNHPSGNLKCSPQDMQILEKMEKMAGMPVHGVIINLKTGKYGTFSTSGETGEGQKRIPESATPMTVHTLDKQIFASDYDPMSQPLVRSVRDVASFLNSHRMGDRAKASFLILSRAGRIVGNIHTPFTDITKDVDNVARYISEKVIQFGGESAILYGDFAVQRSKSARYRTLQQKVKDAGSNLLDIVHVEGNHTNSANDEGLLYEPGSEYGAPDLRFRGVEDDSVLSEFADGMTVKAYRTMQVIDGKLYSPMATKVGGKATPEITLGKPEQSEEHPEIIKGTKIGRDGIEQGYVVIDKGQGKGILTVAYNPYIHSSRTVLNDQFSSAYIRPNLVTVEVEVPQSELTSGYRAQMAKDAVGEISWHSGSVSGQLADLGKPRRVILTRYDRPVRIVPFREVAEMIAVQLDGTDIAIPYNVVQPQLRAELERLGVAISEEATGSVSDAQDFGKSEYVTDQEIERINTRQREMAQTSPEAKSGHAEAMAKKFNTPIRIVNDVNELTSSNAERQARMRKSKGFYDPHTGEIVVVVPNNANVEDVAETVFHEVVAHKGLRELIGEENYDTFCDEVYDHLKDELRQQVDEEITRRFMKEPGKGYEHHRRVSVDEMFGRMSEKGFEDFTKAERGIWAKLKAKVLEAINKFLGSLKLPKWIKLGDNELRYMLWRSHEKLRTKGDYVGMARDAAKREELGLSLRFRDSETGDIWKDRSVGLEERITNAAVRLANNQSGDLTLRNDAMRAIGGNLTSLRRAMALQRTFDQTTAKRVADLAQILMQNGYLSDMTSGEMQRLISAVKNAVGHQEVKESVQKVMDIMVQNQLRNGEATLRKLLAIRGSKVDARGVEVQGALDVEGQRTMEVVKKAMSLSEDDINDRIAEALNRMSDSDQTIADQAAIEYAGLSMALDYVQNIEGRKADEKALRDNLKTAKEDKDAGRLTADAYKQFVEATEDAIWKNKIERAEAYFNLVGRLSDSLRGSIENAKAFREAEKARVNEIHHNANSDMEGRPTNEHHRDNWQDKIANNGFVQFLFSPLGTFDQIMRVFGNKSTNGEGYLWNRFMRGWIECRNKELQGVKDKFAQLDDKAAELFGKGKTWGSIIRMERKMPKATVSFWDGGEMRDHELTQGNLLYIYMVDKMSDGRMKLRRMGITEDDIVTIENFLDPRFIALGDWLQNEFLIETRNEYNETHKRMFGASMAAIENYFPLKILANARIDKEEDVNQQNRPDGITTKTGSIIKRRVNNLALDITSADTLSVILDHIIQMEHWSAYAEWNRDLNTLRTYKRFRNQVINMTTVYGGGHKLWEKFNDLSLMAAGEYRPPIANLDKSAVNIAKGVTAAKVSFRMFTALKQLLSAPAYAPEVSIRAIAKSIANPYGDFKWCLNNLPIFRERWSSRISGDPRLLKSDMDWKMWRSRVMELSSRIGMTPNAFVDALTVSIGARAMYETRLKQYQREGYPADMAEERAKQDATILFNQTQQSSESPFLSTMQVDSSWLSVLFTVFRNSAMSYTRQEFDALRNLKRNLTPGQRTKSVEFMTKQVLRDWNIDPDTASDAERGKAEETAKKRFRRQIKKDVIRLATFGLILEMAWNLGAYLPYIIFGNDDDEKGKMWDNAITHAYFGSVEGLTGGDVMSSFGNMAASGEWNWNQLSKDMPLASDINKIATKFIGSKNAEAINDIINLLVQSGIGMNPQSITDAAVAITDACGDDPALSHEAAIFVMRVLQVPQSQLDKMYFDEIGLSGEEASKLTPEQLAQRYAEYKVKRGTPLAPWSWDNEERLEKYEKSAEKKMKERLESQGDAEVNEAYADFEARYNAVSEKVKAAKDLIKTDYAAAAQAFAAVQQDPDFGLYQRFSRLDKQLGHLSKMWLTAKSPEEAALVSGTISSYRADMVKALQAETMEAQPMQVNR